MSSSKKIDLLKDFAAGVYQTGDPVSHVGILVFSTQVVNCCPSNILCGSTLLPHFPVSKYSIYRQCVAGRGWRVLNLVETIF
jgi:hypothetical protein